jgi:predicted SprT family Zn-dependent metalloprotease
MNNELSKTITELYRIFDALNERYFGKELEYPFITIQKSRANNLGHFTLSKIWKNEETGDSLYEININPVNLNRSVVEISATLLHEMIHYYNKVNDIKDATNNVHNKKFKRAAEERDLIVTKGKSVGWGYTEPTDEFINWIKENVNPDEDCFKYFMSIPQIEKEDKTTNKKIFKYTCPKCGMEAKAKPEMKLFCGFCKVELEMEEN